MAPGQPDYGGQQGYAVGQPGYAQPGYGGQPGYHPQQHQVGHRPQQQGGGGPSMMAVGGAAVAGGVVGAVAGNALYNADWNAAGGVFRLSRAHHNRACTRVRLCSSIVMPSLVERWRHDISHRYSATAGVVPARNQAFAVRRVGLLRAGAGSPPPECRGVLKVERCRCVREHHLRRALTLLPLNRVGRRSCRRRRPVCGRRLPVGRRSCRRRRPVGRRCCRRRRRFCRRFCRKRWRLGWRRRRGHGRLCREHWRLFLSVTSRSKKVGEREILLGTMSITGSLLGTMSITGSPGRGPV